jgi:hypothetical protein
MTIDWKDYYPLFTPDEFVCKCGCGKMNMQKEHMDMLFRARILAGIPFVIRSGCRCENHNRNEGGTETSDHLGGWGTDIQAKSGRAKWIIDEALVKAGFTRLGEGSDFYHAGNDPANPERVRWTY